MRGISLNLMSQAIRLLNFLLKKNLHEILRNRITFETVDNYTLMAIKYLKNNLVRHTVNSTKNKIMMKEKQNLLKLRHSISTPHYES